MRKNKNKLNGFTLTELIVVIAIIGILTGAIIVSLNPSARIAQSRNGVRKSDLHQIQSALEMYRSDQGSYPATIPSDCTSSLMDNGSPPTIVYMRSVPCDPKNTGVYIYKYALNGNGYDLATCLETVTDSKKDSSNNPTSSSNCNGTSNWSYTLHNP